MYGARPDLRWEGAAPGCDAGFGADPVWASLLWKRVSARGPVKGAFDGGPPHGVLVPALFGTQPRIPLAAFKRTLRSCLSFFKTHVSGEPRNLRTSGQHAPGESLAQLVPGGARPSLAGLAW